LLTLVSLFVQNGVSCCACYAGQSSFKDQIAADRSYTVSTEADSNDITEHPLGDKPRPYVCTVCDKQFTTKHRLTIHRISHTGEKLYSCTQCGKCFANKHYLRRHMNIHSSRYKCTECGICCQSNRDLIVHRGIHSGEKPFECAVCSKRFTTSRDLDVHSRIHSGAKPY